MELSTVSGEAEFWISRCCLKVLGILDIHRALSSWKSELQEYSEFSNVKSYLCLSIATFFF